MFIATANMLETIPAPLLDRMEVLQLPGYSEEEKILIAQKYIIPKQLEAHGLPARLVDDRRRRGPQDHRRLHPRGRPAQPRARDRRRSAARSPASTPKGARRRRRSTKAEVSDALGPPRYFREVADRTGTPGVATGLAWTPTGGEILFVEATGMPGKGGLTLTGLLGESMRESAQAAMSYLRSHAKALEHRRLLVPQDRRPHPRPGRRGPQGRPLGRRGDLGRPDEPLPRPGRSARTWR